MSTPGDLGKQSRNISGKEPLSGASRNRKKGRSGYRRGGEKPPPSGRRARFKGKEGRGRFKSLEGKKLSKKKEEVRKGERETSTPLRGGGGSSTTFQKSAAES